MESIRVSQSHFLKKGFVSGRGTGGFDAMCGLGSSGGSEQILEGAALVQEETGTQGRILSRQLI